MTAKAICRVGDQVTGTCNAHTTPRTFIGTWVTGSSIGTVDGLGIIREGDTGITDCNHHFVATEGSSIFKENGIAIHRVGDAVIVTEGGEGVSITGSGTSMSI